jgi:translocation and assembly module TamA
MSRGTAWLAAHAVLLPLLLGGCASLPPFSKDAGPGDAATPAIPERQLYELQIDAPSDLRRLLADYLDVSRFQRVPETEAVTGSELDRLVAAAPAQARQLLETEGYFNAQVRITRATTAAGLPLLRLQVQPGPRTVVEQWSVDVVGDLKRAVEAEDEDAVVELAALRRRWPLKVDEPFREPAWTAAKNTTLARLRAEGYPSATWLSTDAQVEAERNAARTHVVADSGPLFRLGPMTIEGLQRYDETSVHRLATFAPGDPYSEQSLLDYQDRLVKSGLFEGAVVEIDPSPERASATPVTVRLKEHPLQLATVGVGYSANTGPRLTLEHTHRRPFGLRWIATNKFELGPSLKSWEGALTSHPLPGLYRNLLSGSAERLRSAEELRSSWTARIGRTQDKPTIERLYFAELTHSRLETTAGVNDSDALSINYHWIWRRLDSVLLPTKGFTLSTQAAVGHARGRENLSGVVTEAQGPFSRGYGRLTWYLPLGESSWYATLRAEGGQVFAADRIAVPDTLLFRAGGDESVRGYAYRTLGPTVNGAVTSGRVMATGSAEIGRPISPRRPELWWAAFVDAGNAAHRWRELDPVLGYGIGLRWRSPVGPLRLDLAYGQEVRKARVHLSVGIAF